MARTTAPRPLTRRVDQRSKCPPAGNADDLDVISGGTGGFGVGRRLVTAGRRRRGRRGPGAEEPRWQAGPGGSLDEGDFGCPRRRRGPAPRERATEPPPIRCHGLFEVGDGGRAHRQHRGCTSPLRPRAAAHRASWAPAEWPTTTTRSRSSPWPGARAAGGRSRRPVRPGGGPPTARPHPPVLQIPGGHAPAGQVGGQAVHEVPLPGVVPEPAVDQNCHRVGPVAGRAPEVAHLAGAVAVGERRPRARRPVDQVGMA